MDERVTDRTVSIDQLGHLSRPPGTPEAQVEGPVVMERRASPTQATVDQLTSRLYEAVDAARGAEAERAASEVLRQELEYQLHILTAEVATLKAALAAKRTFSVADLDRYLQAARNRAAKLARGR